LVTVQDGSSLTTGAPPPGMGWRFHWGKGALDVLQPLPRRNQAGYRAFAVASICRTPLVHPDPLRRIIIPEQEPGERTALVWRSGWTRGNTGEGHVPVPC